MYGVYMKFCFVLHCSFCSSQCCGRSGMAEAGCWSPSPACLQTDGGSRRAWREPLQTRGRTCRRKSVPSCCKVTIFFEIIMKAGDGLDKHRRWKWKDSYEENIFHRRGGRWSRGLTKCLLPIWSTVVKRQKAQDERRKSNVWWCQLHEEGTNDDLLLIKAMK